MQYSLYLDLMKLFADVTQQYIDALSVAGITGLTPFDAHVLVILLDGGKQHVSVVAREMGRPATSFTPNVDKLEQLGLAERQPDPEDRRAVWLSLTEQGGAAAAQCKAALTATHDELKVAFQQTDEETRYRRFMLRYAPTHEITVRPYARKPVGT